MADSERYWKGMGEDPCVFLRWLYEHPGGTVAEFDESQRAAYYDEGGNPMEPPPYDEFDWDHGLDELRNAGLITGGGWENLHPEGELERQYPTVPHNATVELTAAGREYVEQNCL